MNTDTQSNRSPDPADDPTVEEIRSIRRRMWEAAGHDIHRYILQSREAAERLRPASAGEDHRPATAQRQDGTAA